LLFFPWSISFATEKPMLSFFTHWKKEIRRDK
jgi:hypothetical protein